MAEKNSPEVIGDVLKLLTYTIERIFEEQRLQREILLSIDIKEVDPAAIERNQLWSAIRQLEENVAQVVISQATQNRMINEIRDWLMPRSVRFRKWWQIWRSK